ncbi:ketopantoate reductase family protein [Paenibacillus aceti]|uniref:2-dehydropantoate 2-reductase n=1 Tax=Paenibacillus aceti TaxID=1820010 RepID=A0ABQ1VN99_9BACL|nr:2-dehydropantoate 2-reductase [Paenibacillus aceti]GGF82866.1 2-dehydropantoate 2-reductase [Paenibacillus aceti]
MKVDIIGAGALGLLFGGKLAAAGVQVRFWTRTAEQSRLLQQEGINVEEPHSGVLSVAPSMVRAYPAADLMGGEVDGLAEGAADWIFVMTKQRSVDSSLLETVHKIAGPETGIICFQNGMGHIELFRSAFKAHGVYVAITTEGAKRQNSRYVIRSGAGSTQIGIPRTDEYLLFKEGLSEKAEKYATKESDLVNMLESAGFAAFLSKDIDREIYRKLLINAVINPLTALWRIPNGELLDTEPRRGMLQQLCEEGLQVYQAHQISVPSDMYEQIVSVCRSTAGNTSSMLSDVLKGAPTEIDSINGRLVAMAQAAGITVPGHEIVWNLIKGMQAVSG